MCVPQVFVQCLAKRDTVEHGNTAGTTIGLEAILARLRIGLVDKLGAKMWEVRPWMHMDACGPSYPNPTPNPNPKLNPHARRAWRSSRRPPPPVCYCLLLSVTVCYCLQGMEKLNEATAACLLLSVTVCYCLLLSAGHGEAQGGHRRLRQGAGPHTAHSHTVHLPLCALLTWCPVCGTGKELHSKFCADGDAFTMSYGGLDLFFGGLEALVFIYSYK